MKNDTNKFGNGVLYDIEDLEGTIFCQCCACMSVSSDFLSWANYVDNIHRIVNDPFDADNIIVLSCQVTDLAVLNDLRYLEELIDQYPDKKFFIGGCLAKRFDISLPDNCDRLDNVRIDYQPIVRVDLLNYSHPFWVEDWDESCDDSHTDGNLFRYCHPVRIGSGCVNKCIYCTINITRGEFCQLKPRSINDLSHSDNVLIADSPTIEQLHEWSELALRGNRPISFRNVEPNAITNIFTGQGTHFINRLIEHDLLEILHCPIQSPNPDVLKDMGRSVEDTLYFINEVCPIIKERGDWTDKSGVFLATNIIIDYKNFPNPTPDELDAFNYVSWNPYWDGIWDIDKAKERWNHYFPWNKI